MERERQRQVAAKQREHEATVRRVQAVSQRHNDALATIELGMAARDKENVEKYLAEVVPTVRAYQYIQRSDEERASDRPAKEVAIAHRSVVSQVALLCSRNLLQSDNKLDMIGFNGHVQMSPGNFEHLVRQVFVAQGAEGWTIEQSNDDGVGAVIAKRTALMGGLSIVQAKRYKPSNTLGPSHVRELAGAMAEKRRDGGFSSPHLDSRQGVNKRLESIAAWN